MTDPRDAVAEAARGKLTAAFVAMTPLQKWEALALHGLLGTDEPWIEDMRRALKEQEGQFAIERAVGQRQIEVLQADNACLRADLDKAMPDATKCEACLAPLFENDPGILTDENEATTCTPAMPMPGAEDDPALDVVRPGECFCYRSLDRTVALADLERKEG